MLEACTVFELVQKEDDMSEAPALFSIGNEV